MDRCVGGASRRAGLALTLKAWSDTVNRSLKADRIGVMGRKAATESRATRTKEPGN
jgi:hypothetical protein